MPVEENNLVKKGIHYIVSNHPSKQTPLQLYFLFAGDADLEMKIMRGVIKKGYSISRVWFVDKTYKAFGQNNAIIQITNKLETIPTFTNNVHPIESFPLMMRHERNMKIQNRITPNSMFKHFKDSTYANVVFLNDFSQLTALMENYIDTNETHIAFAIHHQAIGEGAGEKIGTFYKMYFSKFNKPIIFMWREYPYIAVVEPHPDSKNLSSKNVLNYANTKQRALMYEIDRERYTYNGHSYVIQIGKRGARYILVNNKKKYI